MFERLRAAFNALLDGAAGPTDPAARVARMREAVIQARAALEGLREGVPTTERELSRERRELEAAERRGRLAEGIQDRETVEVAARFAAKHRERVAVLERKLAAQREELTLAERDVQDMKKRLRETERTLPVDEASRRVDSAWRSVEAAGGARPATDVEGEHLRSDLDRRAREARADRQLDDLKKRMGKQ